MSTAVCRDCNVSFELEKKRGRPAVRCTVCRAARNTEPNDVDIATAIVQTANRIDLSSVPNVVIERTEKQKSKEPPLGTNKYEIIVTNLGFAHRGENQSDAIAAY